MTKKKYVLFDGSNISHIAFHRAKSIVYKEVAEREEKKNARDVDPVNDLTQDDIGHIEGMMYHVFFMKVHNILKKFPNSYYMFAWDAAGSSDWRKEKFPEYKSNRVYTEDPTWKILFNNINEIKKVLEYYPVHQSGYEKLEADDILFVYGKELSESADVVIVSTDSDLTQIAQKFNNVKIFNPLTKKFVKPPKEYDICIFKSIKGEKGDGIPGIKGYGDKKATKLAEEFQKDNESIKDTLKPDEYDIFKRNIELIDISHNPNLHKVDLELSKIHEATKYIDFDKIKKFYFDKKLKTLLETFESVTEVFPA
jgi:DNA polymerase I